MRPKRGEEMEEQKKRAVFFLCANRRLYPFLFLVVMLQYLFVKKVRLCQQRRTLCGR